MEHIEDNSGNRKTVYVVMSPDGKDMTDARRYGDLRVMFLNTRRPYDTAKTLGIAREVLSRWQPGDYLLMIGDPMLCAVSMTVLAETQPYIDVLSWDRVRLQYAPTRWELDF